MWADRIRFDLPATNSCLCNVEPIGHGVGSSEGLLPYGFLATSN